MWHSHHAHKAWLPLRSSLSALRPHPQLPLWSVMGLLRSASSILITGQNPFNGIWFARKGRGRAVSHWTRLSLETSIPLHPPPPPFAFPSGGWHVHSALYHPYHSCSMAGCVCACVCVCVYVCVYGCVGEGVHRQRRGAAVPSETLFVAYRSTSLSMLSGLDRLKGWKCNLLSCWDR